MAHSKTAPPPLVSVGMPIYNGAATVRRALDALLAQDYQHFELIVSDNASTDDTWDILSAYAARDTRVRLFRNEQNQGALDNFHRVFELAQGEYFMWAAHDDWWEPSFISTCLGLLVAQPQAALCYPHSRFYYSQEERCENRRVDALQGDHPEAWQRLYSFMKIEPLPAVLTYGLCRRENLRRVLPLGNYNGSDNVMLMRLLITGTFVKADAYLFNYTVKRPTPGGV